MDKGLDLGKGSRTERELVNLLWEKGYAVMRSPSSGAGRKHPQPDILYSNGDIPVALECKATSKEKIYVQKDELLKLHLFSKKFGSIAKLAFRFDYEDWLVAEPAIGKPCEKSILYEKQKVKKL